MTGKELLYIKTVVDEKSITKAAKKLFIAQPSLSQSIQRLEESLGIALFNRTSSGLTLTYAGERYYHMATQVLKIYEDFELEISDMNNLKTGRIHLGVTNHLGTIVLPHVLPRFCELCPFIELHVLEENSTSLEQKLLMGELDFAVMHAPKEPENSQIDYSILKKDPFLLITSGSHPLAAKAQKREGYKYPVADITLLKNESFIMLPKQQRIRQVTDSVLKRAGISQPDIRLTLKSYETAGLLAARGIGITFIPSQYYKLTPSEYAPALFSIDEKYDATWDMCIATLKGGFLSKADQLFIRILKEIFMH